MWIVDVVVFYMLFGGGVKIYIDCKMVVGLVVGYEIICIVFGFVNKIEECGFNVCIVYLKDFVFLFDWKYYYFCDVEVLYVKFDELKFDIVEVLLFWCSVWLVGEWLGVVLCMLIMYVDFVLVYGYCWFGGIVLCEIIDCMVSIYW